MTPLKLWSLSVVLIYLLLVSLEDRKGIEPLIETNPARVSCFYVTVTYPYFLTLRLRVSRFPGFLFVTLRILLLENFNLIRRRCWSATFLPESNLPSVGAF